MGWMFGVDHLVPKIQKFVFLEIWFHHIGRGTEPAFESFL